MADPREGRSLARVFARSQSGHFHAQRSASRVSLHRFISAPQRSSRAACSRRGYATLKTPAAIDAPCRCVRGALRPSVRIMRPHPQASGAGNASRQRAVRRVRCKETHKSGETRTARSTFCGRQHYILCWYLQQPLCKSHKNDHFLN
jgi:hypothetical protein